MISRVNLVRHAVITVYLFLNLCAFVFTMSRYEIIPSRYFFTFYGMMAPFQGYITHDWQLVASGYTEDGTWEEISLEPYLQAFGRGEKIMRGGLVTFRLLGDRAVAEQYEKLAYRIQELQAQKGKYYESVRLSMHFWPASPLGYEALRMEPFIREEFITSVSCDIETLRDGLPMVRGSACHPEVRAESATADEASHEG